MRFSAGRGISKPGRDGGTEVLDYTTSQNLNAVTSTSETLERKGYHVTTKEMYIDRISAHTKLAADLNVAEGSELIRIQRIKLADNMPIAIMKNYLKPSFVPGIEKYGDKFTRLYDFLDEHYGIYIDTAKDRITAKNASFEEAQIAQRAGGHGACVPHPHLLLRRRTHRRGPRPASSGGRYEFEVLMKGRYKQPKS